MGVDQNIPKFARRSSSAMGEPLVYALRLTLPNGDCWGATRSCTRPSRTLALRGISFFSCSIEKIGIVYCLRLQEGIPSLFGKGAQRTPAVGPGRTQSKPERLCAHSLGLANRRREAVLRSGVEVRGAGDATNGRCRWPVSQPLLDMGVAGPVVRFPTKLRWLLQTLPPARLGSRTATDSVL
jgi:hypothetical protein